MAATGKTPILLYGSTTATNVPLAGNLTNSTDGCEIAINVADKNLFFKDSTNAVNTVPIRQSSASSNGWLSSTDWNTFNNKASTSSPTLTGDVTLSTGNLVIGTSGKGIDFSVTSQAAGMTSELLADYEEGTFTPTLTASSSNPTITYTLQRGEYVKVGSLVYVAVYMAWSARSGGSGDARFNLPFTTAASPGAYGAGAISTVTGVTFDSGRTFVAMQPQPNTTYLNMVEMGSNASSITLTLTNFGTGAGSLSYTCTYKV